MPTLRSSKNGEQAAATAVDRPTLSQLAYGVIVAYDVFSLLPDGATDAAAISAIKYLYRNRINNVQPIWVYEQDISNRKRLFGYAATIATVPPTYPPKNVLILRGTVTTNESALSADGWDTQTPCYLPTPDSKTSYGLVKKSYFDWYTRTRTEVGAFTSLASSLKSAVSAVLGAKNNYPWYAATHSLGGALLDFGVMDLVTQGTFTPATSPIVVTFGSVAVGNNDWANAYNARIPQTIRVANLCDFVPSIRSVLGTEPLVNLYTHVGQGYFFVWQKNADWLNHSLKDTYYAMVNNSDLFTKMWTAAQPPIYPAQIVQSVVENGVGEGQELLRCI
jgi:hypothetical protein